MSAVCFWRQRCSWSWIESLLGTSKTKAPYLTRIDDPAMLWHELEARGGPTQGSSGHQRIARLLIRDAGQAKSEEHSGKHVSVSGLTRPRVCSGST